MNSTSQEAQRLVDHLQEGESTYSDVQDLRALLAGHAAALAPKVLERIAALTTATDHGWNFVTGEEYSERVDCAPAARLARAELERRRRGGHGLGRAERERARRRSSFAAMARRPRAQHFGLLVSGLADPDLDVRVRAAAALGKLGERKAVPALARALGSPDSALREAAATALGRLGGPRACAALRARLGDDTDTVVAKVAAALGAQRDARAVGPLVALVGPSWNDYAEPHVLRALQRIGRPAVAAVRRAVLTQRYERARFIPLLARLDPRGAPAVLAPLVGEEDAGTVDAAIEALGALGGKAALAALEDQVSRIRPFHRSFGTLRRALARAAKRRRRP